jgi:periplasmic divalent cation tolerance protein
MSATLVYITAPDFAEAERLARELVENRLAACANLVPRIVSTYWWDNRVCEEEEALIIVKTTRELVGDLIAAVKKSHPYEVPAILAIDAVDGNPDFIRWLHGEVRPQ